jgi:hypothetical protein
MRQEFNSRGDGTKTPDDIVIFLDIDGVLSNFEEHLKAKGKAKEDGSPKWDELDHAWWSTIPVFQGAKKFYSDLKKLGIVKFLSAPIPDVGSFSGKAEWIQSVFQPERGRFALLNLVLCSAKDKRFLAAPGRILVDDRIKNVREWEAAGGIGVHHKGNFAETLQAVKDAIATYRKGPPAAVPGPSPEIQAP